MKKPILFLAFILNIGFAYCQLSPAITGWMQNQTGLKGRYYLSGNSTPITSSTDANVQQVQYSANYVYVNATGIPAYVTGPFAIGTITIAADNSYTFKIPLNPTPATTHTAEIGRAS